MVRKLKRGEKKLRDAGVARTFCIIAHLLHQICQILPRVFANSKKKGKERYNVMQAKEKKVPLKTRFPKG